MRAVISPVSTTFTGTLSSCAGMAARTAGVAFLTYTSTTASPGATSEAPTPRPTTPSIRIIACSCCFLTRVASATAAGSTGSPWAALAAGESQAAILRNRPFFWLAPLVHPTMLTPKPVNTLLIGLATVRVLLPAKRSPTARGQVATFSTINEPESPPALKVPGLIANWLTNYAVYLPIPHVLE